MPRLAAERAERGEHPPHAIDRIGWTADGQAAPAVLTLRWCAECIERVFYMGAVAERRGYPTVLTTVSGLREDIGAPETAPEEGGR